MAEFFGYEKFAKSIPGDPGEELVACLKWIRDRLEKQQQQIYAQGLRIRDLETEDSQ